MTPNDLISAISTVGFPIVMCLYLVYSNQKQSEQTRETLDKLAETITTNTLAVNTLAERLREKTE